MSTPKRSVREQILEATYSLLVREQPDTSMEAIARAAGVSRQTVYVQFSSRSNLLVETAKFLDEKAGLQERVAPYRQAPDALTAMRLFIDFWSAYKPVVYPLAKVLIAARDRDAGAREAWDDRMSDVRRGCRRLVDRLLEEARLSPAWAPDEAAEAMFGLLSLPAWEVYVRDLGWSQERYTAAMHRIVAGVLLADPGTYQGRGSP